MKYREPNGDYKGLDGISQEYTTQQIEAIQSAGQTQISNINSVLQEAKDSGEFDGPQGPKGDTGDIGPQGPQGIPGITAIDDTSGSGDTDKTWSADKLVSEFSDLENAIPTVPTKVSQFENDSGYLTQHQDISNKADKTDIPTKVSELTNDSGYLISETDPTVPAWAKAAQKPTYTASEVGALPSNTHIPSTTAELTNDAGFITSSALPTKVSDLTNDAGYLTQHQDISGKANSADLAAVATSGDYADLNNKPTIPTVPVQDVQVDGTSVLQNGVADVPAIAVNQYGVAKIGYSSESGLEIGSTGNLRISHANVSNLKAGNNTFQPITPDIQHNSVFYGLAKASGDTTQSQSDNAVGMYTTEAKAAIQTMLNVPSKTDTILDTTLSRGRKESTTVGASSFAFGDNVQASGLVSHAEGRGTTASGELAHAEGNYAKAYGFASHAEGNYTEASGNSSHVEGYGTVASGELSHAEGSQTVAIGPHSHAEGHNNYRLSTNAYEINDQQYNLNYGAVGTADHSEGYDTIADSTLGGTLNDSYAAHAEGVGTIAVANAQHAQGKWNTPDTNFADVVGNGTENARSNAYALTWSGDGKFAGNVYVGCGTDSSGGTMLPKDVQVNGTSIVDQNGIANVPRADANTYGTAKVSSNLGININSEGFLTIGGATSDVIKAANTGLYPITPQKEHEAVFYGLAKVAGADMASSSNAVGTYTDEAKAAIQAMLGIDLSSIASQVEIPLVETIDGAAVIITGQPNTRYMCGEVTSISITPPAAGSIDVVFTSGSTVAVLTLPSTVKMPEWFDDSTLDTNTVYEILITDGVYGSVMTWAT